MKNRITHRLGQKGFSSQMADEINRQQATKSHRKEVAKKFHAPKPKQGYTPSRPSIDTNTLG